MTGTDSTQDPVTPAGGPAIILVETQLAENIGTTSRAMYNCGLTDLRLVKPRQNWLSPRALAASSGAVNVLEAAQVYESTEEAIADLEFVAATTARPRDNVKPVWTPRHAGGEFAARAASNMKLGILYGREKSGLKNEDVSLADVIIEVPLNPAYSSLNLAQAVLVVAYEWFQATQSSESVTMPYRETRPATKDELTTLFDHLEHELDESGFLRVKEKRPSMILALRALLQRAALTEQEVRTLHGVVTELRYGNREDFLRKYEWKRKG
jgi:tRNA/rRNA methyltransferase